jgi:CysZ protein
MGLARLSQFFLPTARAVGQLDDPAFRGVLLRSLAWSLACVIVLLMGTIWAVGHLLALHGWLGWAAGFIGTIGAALLALWLFLPVAAGIGALYLDRIAVAVERRFYPWLPVPESASIYEQSWDGIAIGLKILGLNIVALLLTVMVPGLGFVLGWMIAGYAIGRGLFVAVAMRRMPRAMAESLYRRRRGAVLAQGAIVAVAAYIPVLNLFIPIVATAAMVHVLDMTSEVDRLRPAQPPADLVGVRQADRNNEV